MCCIKTVYCQCSYFLWWSFDLVSNQNSNCPYFTWALSLIHRRSMKYVTVWTIIWCRLLFLLSFIFPLSFSSSFSFECTHFSIYFLSAHSHLLLLFFPIRGGGTFCDYTWYIHFTLFFCLSFLISFLFSSFPSDTFWASFSFLHILSFLIYFSFSPIYI